MKPKIVLSSITINYDYILTKHYYKLPSLGIGYIAAVLENNGYEVTIVDKTVSNSNDGIVKLADEILATRPDIVGFYCISETFKNILKILKIIKDRKPSVITMIGGPHVYGLPAQGMGYDWIDYSFHGEAEEAVLKLLKTNFNRNEFINIPGLIYREGKEIKINPMALVHDLDSLPLPARHLYPPLSLYMPSLASYKRLPATGIKTSHGCAHKCVFCHSGRGHFKLRFHSAEYVLNEIRYLKNNLGINEIIFLDDTFLINKDRVLSICEGIIKEKLDISWSCNARVNDVSREILKVLKRAGCWLIQFDVESGNQEILKTIKKNITLEQVENACKMACKEGLEVKTYFILGHPKETEETLNDTIRFMTKLPIHYLALGFMTPFPGTEMWDIAQDFGHFDKEKLESINYLSDKPAFIPFGLTEEIMVNKLREAYLKFYLNPGLILRHVRNIRRPEDLKKIVLAARILFKLFL